MRESRDPFRNTKRGEVCMPCTYPTFSVPFVKKIAMLNSQTSRPSRRNLGQLARAPRAENSHDTETSIEQHHRIRNEAPHRRHASCSASVSMNPSKTRPVRYHPMKTNNTYQRP